MDLLLADLEELSDNEVDVMVQENIEKVGGELSAELELKSLTSLKQSQRYKKIMQNIEDALLVKDCTKIPSDDDDNDYEFIKDTNTLLVNINDEIILIYNFIRDKYRAKFPELESIIDHPIVYVHVVKKIGNAMDLNLVALEELLPPRTNMSVLFAGLTTNGKPLPEDVLDKIIEACDHAFELDTAQKKILDFVESRMSYIAPNLSTIVGSSVAAKLVGAAGGLATLANIPACDIMLLRPKKSKHLVGFSFSSQSRVGYVEETEIVQSTPPPLRVFASHQVAAKSALAVRVDSVRGDPTGTIGRRFLEEIRNKIEKRQEPPPARIPKPLPVPVGSLNPKKKRGGRRLRNAKKTYCATNKSKLANRMQFGVAEESSLGDGYGVGYGILGQAGSGQITLSLCSKQACSQSCLTI